MGSSHASAVANIVYMHMQDELLDWITTITMIFT